MAEVIEVFPVDKGIIQTDIDLFDQNTTIKILGSDVIVEAGDKSLVIVYGAVFISLGNVASIKDASGKEITLESLIYSSKVQYKKSITTEESENEDFLLIKDKDQSLVGQETTAEQEQVTDFSNPKFSKKEVEDIIDNAIAEVKNSEEELDEKLETAKNLKDALDEKKENFDTPPVEKIEKIEKTIINTKSSDLNSVINTFTSDETETIIPVLLTPTWSITTNTNQSVNNIDYASGESLVIENSLIVPVSSNINNVATLNDKTVDLIATTTNFNITGQIDSGVNISVSIATVANPSIAIFTGTTTADDTRDWSIPVTGVNTDGQFLVTVTATDDQDSRATNTRGLTIDTAQPIADFDLDSASDSGAQDTLVDTLVDTNDITPGITGITDAGSSISISSGSVILGTTIANAQGMWNFAIPATATTATNTFTLNTNGTNSITVTVVDIAGNTSNVTQNIVIDSTKPTATFALDRASDTGQLNVASTFTDNITNNITPTITGTTEAGSAIVITDVNGVVLGTSTANVTTGVWSFVIPTTVTDSNGTFTLDVNGDNTIITTITDMTGNSSTATEIITVDNTVPATEFELDVASNTGRGNNNVSLGDVDASYSDNITSDNNPTLTGITESGAVIVITDNNGLELGRPVVDVITGIWNFPIPTTAADGTAFALTEGNNVFSINITDIAGNTNTNTQTIVLDTTPVNTPIITRTLADNINDVGTNIIEGNLGVGADGIPNVTTEVGTIIELSLQPSTGDAIIIGTPSVTDNGSWTYSFDAATVPIGNYTFIATAVDIAGNNTSTTATSVNINPLTDPPTIFLDARSDSFTSLVAEANTHNTNIDGITNLALTTAGPNSIIFRGTAIEGSSVHLSDQNGQFGFVTVDPDTVDSNGIGQWEFIANNSSVGLTTMRGLTSQSDHTITAETIVGTAPPSSPVTLTYTIDATSPNAVAFTSEVPVFLGVAINITGNGGETDTPGNTFVVLELTRVGSSDTEYIHSSIVAADGSWDVSIEPNLLSTAGDYIITAIQVDGAGNESPINNPTQAFTVQQNALIVVDENGAADGGDNTPTFVLTVLDGAVAQTSGLTLLITSPSLSANTSITQPPANLIVDLTTSDGTVIGHTYTFASVQVLNDATDYNAQVTGITGVSGISSISESFTIDTTTQNPNNVGLAIDSASTNSATTAITTIPTLTGDAEANAIVVLTIGTITITTTADVNGRWTATVPTDSPLSNGNYNVAIVATDAFGNSSGTATFSFSVLLTALSADVTRVSGDSGGDQHFTNDITPTISGTSVNAVTVNIFNGDVLVGTTTVSNNNWSFNFTAEQGGLGRPNNGITPTASNEVVYTIEAVAGSGQTSEISYSLTYDTTNPDTPINIIIVENADETFTISGETTTTDLGTDINRIAIYNNGDFYANANINADGTWTETGSVLVNGVHNFTVEAIDDSGNTSDRSSAVTASNFNVQLTGDTDTGAEGVNLNTATPTLTGNGNFNNIIIIDAQNNRLSNSDISQTGSGWSADITSLLAENVSETLTISDGTTGISSVIEVTYDDPATT